MTQFKVSEAAALLGVNDDSVRRWAEAGRVTIHKGTSGRMYIEGAELAPLAQELPQSPRSLWPSLPRRRQRATASPGSSPG